MTQPSRLDFLHKGVYPPIAITLTMFSVLFSVLVWWYNNDRQGQNDRLLREMNVVKLQQEEQGRRSEEAAHLVRVAFCKQTMYVQTSNSEAVPSVRAQFALLFAVLLQLDKEQVGEDRANELWDKARKQAEKEVKAEVVDWFM